MEPLNGLRVLDLSRLLPGPLATMHLADLGAEVVKIESPDKVDYLRFLEPHWNGQNVGFSVLNRKKKSVILKFEHEAGSKLLRKLVATSDVLVESFRPGYMKRLGLDYDSLKQICPELIYCSISAYGQDNSRAGHDLNCLALSGLSHALGGDEPQVPHTQLADITCGLAASQAILAALYARERGQGGAHLDIAMTDAAYHIVSLESASSRHGVGPFHGGHLSGHKPYYRYYRCSDGKHLAVGAVEEKFQTSILNEMGLKSWTAAEATFLTKPRADWLRLLLPLDACVEPVLTSEEVLKSDWMVQRYGDWVQPPSLHRASFPSEPGDCFSPGEHTAECLGVSDSELQELARQGIVVTFP